MQAQLCYIVGSCCIQLSESETFPASDGHNARHISDIFNTREERQAVTKANDTGDERQEATHSVAANCGKYQRIPFLAVPVKLHSKQRLAVVLLKKKPASLKMIDKSQL